MTERDDTLATTTVGGQPDRINEIVETARTRNLATPAAARETLDREEALIKDSVLRMGAMVEDAIRKASLALTTHDTALALSIIEGDRLINEAQREASGMIAVTIATQQPVARDLRYLLTLDHVTYELERIGDHASSVAKQVMKLAPEPPLKSYIHLPEMAERGAELVHGVLRALVDVDPIAAREIAVNDDEIDTLYHETFDEVVDLMRSDPENVERGTRIIIASHYLERIGDRSTNIAEDIVYLESGEVEDLNP